MRLLASFLGRVCCSHQLYQHRSLFAETVGSFAMTYRDSCVYITVPDFSRPLSPGFSLTGSFQWGRTKWQV